MISRYLGCHVSAQGGLKAALLRGERLEVNTIQIHPCAPQRWNTVPFAANIESDYLAHKRESPVKKVFFHGIYLINLATPNLVNREKSEWSLIHDLDLAARIGAEGVIFHVGSLKDEPDETAGLERAAASIDTILSRSPGDTPLLLEVSAGSGKIIGSRFLQLARIFDGVSPQNQKRVLFALDSQHLWASGYDIAEHLETLLGEIQSTVGMERIAAIHLNDSKSTLASCHDRHADLGTGTIGWNALSAFINHPLLRDIPTILETPSLRTEDGARQEVAALRRMANGEPASL